MRCLIWQAVNSDSDSSAFLSCILQFGCRSKQAPGIIDGQGLTGKTLLVLYCCLLHKPCSAYYYGHPRVIERPVGHETVWANRLQHVARCIGTIHSFL